MFGGSSLEECECVLPCHEHPRVLPVKSRHSFLFKLTASLWDIHSQTSLSFSSFSLACGISAVRSGRSIWGQWLSPVPLRFCHTVRIVYCSTHLQNPPPLSACAYVSKQGNKRVTSNTLATGVDKPMWKFSTCYYICFVNSAIMKQFYLSLWGRWESILPNRKINAFLKP